MTENLETLTLPDGRTLGYAQWGDPSGTPIISIHGTPGSRLGRHPDPAKVAATGARVVTYDRPGYGASDRHRGRVVVDCVPDITAIADALGFDTFAIAGGSGGGPHCLAVAAALPDRVTRAACLVGVAPYDALGDSWLDGMDPANVREFGWALEGEDRLAAELPREAAMMVQQVAEAPENLLANFDLPDADKAILRREDIAQVIREQITESFRNGVWGWVDDDVALTLPWGFDPKTVTVPTAVWWGAEDVLVPAAHGEWLAATMPNAAVRIERGGGHLGDPDDTLRNLYPWLLDGTPWSD